VVIPAFNAAATLPRCLESVFAQTLRPNEVIVVDDGSTDNTMAVAGKLGASVITRTNGGPSAARNAGLRAAVGEWIALLDADDTWASRKLERQTACICPKTVLVYTGISMFDDNGLRGVMPAGDPAWAVKILRYRNPIATSSVLMRLDAALIAGGFRETTCACEDWELWVRLQRLGQFEAVVDPLTGYYICPNTLSANPARMLQGLDQIIDTTLLADVRGVERWIWRRRILATQLCSAGLIARDNRRKDELLYLFQSLCTWPSPFWEPRRFAILATSAKKALRRQRRTM